MKIITEIQELWDNYKRCNRDTGKRKKWERNKRNNWSYNDWEFYEINGRHQTIDPGSLENAKDDKY